MKEWDALTPDEKKTLVRQVDVFAAYVAHSDDGIGRVIQEVESRGKLDHTPIIYISGQRAARVERAGDRRGHPGDGW